MSSATVKRLMTAKEFFRKYENKPGVELVRGHILRKPMTGMNHCEIEMTIGALLLDYVKKKKLGRVAIGEVGILVQKNPDTMRGADVIYLSYASWPREKPTPPCYVTVPPELVVEIRSPTDRMKTIREKTEEYLAAGVKVVMVVDPETESIALFRDEELPVRFHNGDTVTIPDVLPGFKAPVKAFFE